MTELYCLYTNARQRDEDFPRRIVPLIRDDARIDELPEEGVVKAHPWGVAQARTPALLLRHFPECADHAVYWKTEYDLIRRGDRLLPLSKIEYGKNGGLPPAGR